MSRSSARVFFRMSAVHFRFYSPCQMSTWRVRRWHCYLLLRRRPKHVRPYGLHGSGCALFCVGRRGQLDTIGCVREIPDDSEVVVVEVSWERRIRCLTLTGDSALSAWGEKNL